MKTKHFMTILFSCSTLFVVGQANHISNGSFEISESGIFPNAEAQVDRLKFWEDRKETLGDSIINHLHSPRLD